MINHYKKNKKMTYYFSKSVNYNFDTAIANVTEELKKEGFGIITEIDIKDTFKKKLNVDFKKYRILGACNPNFAYQAILKENKIGTMLPCNIIVQEHENGTVEVTAVDPVASMMAVNNGSLISLASQVREKLSKVIENL
jgi:uncharacterized protein (DUF302 family)